MATARRLVPTALALGVAVLLVVVLATSTRDPATLCGSRGRKQLLVRRQVRRHSPLASTLITFCPQPCPDR